MKEKRTVKVALTKDGSRTLISSKFNEYYHSINGAYTETKHIFINLGFNTIDKEKINILEIGYGTGLNAMCTFLMNIERKRSVFYHGIEKFPLDRKIIEELEYSSICPINKDQMSLFSIEWDKKVAIDSRFELFKQLIDIADFKSDIEYDLIYFDAFSPDIQPEMWSFENLKKILTVLSTDGVFVTYCSRGVLKSRLRDLGMKVKRFPGPPGKRHVVRATKH